MAKIYDNKIGDYRCAMYKSKLGYTYKIFYNGKCVDRCYVNINDRLLCFNKMNDNLDCYLAMIKHY